MEENLDTPPVNNQCPLSPKTQRLLLICAICVLVAAIWIPLAIAHAPKDHILSKAPAASAKDIVSFEATYYGYLSTLTIPIMAGLLVVLVTSHDSGKWRIAALASMCAFSGAMISVTIGYAIRVGWMNSGTGMPPWVVGFDKYFSGPLTAICYIVGISMLVVVAVYGPPPNKSN